jgi:hypothetical protein
MNSMALRVLLSALVVGAAVFALAKTAVASHLMVEVSASDQLEVGQPAQLQIALRSADGAQHPANVPVTVYTEVSFGGVTGEVELGTALTDANGVAILDFEPRLAGEYELRIEYLHSGDAEPEVATAVVTVAGTSQLYQSTSGIQIPGLNVWLIIALVGSVWSILFSVGLRVLAIARASANGEEAVAESGPVAAAQEAGRIGS